MKSVKEIAETANVSKTSIYNLIKRHSIPTFKREGKTFLDESGEGLVIGYYSTEQHETISDIIRDTTTESEAEGRQDEFQGDFQDVKLIEYTRIIGILEDERGKKTKSLKNCFNQTEYLAKR